MAEIDQKITKEKVMTTETISSLTQDTDAAAEYFERKNAFTTGPVEVSYLLKEKKNGINIVDVRAKEDYAKGHVPGAVNLPKDQWQSPNGSLKKDRINILYCYSQTCHLASKAAYEFASKGFSVMEMEGGFETWSEKGIPIEH